MKLNTSTIIRVIIWFALYAAWITSLVAFNVFDGLIRSFSPALYIIAIVLGAIAQSIAYGVLPTKKTVLETQKQLGNTSRAEPGAPSGRDRAIGYWLWLGIGAVLYAFWLPFYISEL